MRRGIEATAVKATAVEERPLKMLEERPFQGLVEAAFESGFSPGSKPTGYSVSGVESVGLQPLRETPALPSHAPAGQVKAEGTRVVWHRHCCRCLPPSEGCLGTGRSALRQAQGRLCATHGIERAKTSPTQETQPLVIQSAQREESAVRLLSPRCLGTPWLLLALLVVALSTPRLAAQTAGQPSSSTRLITLDQAIDRALLNSPTIKATRTQINQNKAQETTANLRPNPLLSWDAQFLPIFQPENFTSDFLNQNGQFDLGIGYLFELGGKRKARLQAALDTTTVTTAQVGDAERTLKFNVAQQFINALLAKSNLGFALKDLASFQDTVRINEERYKAGDISKNDYLKIRIQLLQNESAVAADRLAKAQALISLRQLIGYQSVPRDYDVAGDLEFRELKSSQADLETAALDQRPDLRAAKTGITAAQSQVRLAKANGVQDLNFTFDYSHVAGTSTGSFFFNIPLPVFNRNQGEIARTRFALTQAEFTAQASQEIVLTDVRNGYEAVKSNEEIVRLYEAGYLQQAEESRDISYFAYRQGSAALLDYLDAERSYRVVQLQYRQALAAYMLALEQLRQAVGVRALP